MKSIYRALTLFSALGLAPVLHAATVEVGRDLEDQDIRALKEWIDTKRQISLKELGGDLSISGEVRTEFQSAWETRNGVRQRGSRIGDLSPARGFDIEFNLMFDYRTERTWAAVKLEFDNDAGVFSGTLDDIGLEKAYWGARLISCDNITFDIEVGRRPFSSVFDSKIEFSSFFDGILFRWDRTLEKAGDIYIHTGPFVINDRRDHFGYIAEFGWLGIGGTGFYSKLSIIDWDTKHYRPSFVNDRFRFVVLQWIPAYRFKVNFGCSQKVAIIYSAILWNTVAKRLPVSDFRRASLGGYVGFSVGQLQKQWDWAFDCNYQVVGAQAIPDYDVSGIGLGNANRSGFYTVTTLPLNGGGIATTVDTAGGMTNYHGFVVRLDILLTDKLDMQQSYQQTHALDHDIGPRRSYKQYEMEFIYSW